MLSSSVPTKFNIPWANGASTPYIRPVPQASQIGIQNGAASLTDGFPPLTFQPITSGGVPPFGADMNGILNQATAWLRWFSAGGPVAWDSAFSTAVGGYPKNCIVQSATTDGLLWRSTVDNNTTNPDTGGAGWVAAATSVGSGLTASAGYIKFPCKDSSSGYFIVEWTRYSITPNQTTNQPGGTIWGQQTVTWPLAFPTGIIAAQATPIVTTNGQFTFPVVSPSNSNGLLFANVWNDASVTTPLVGYILLYGT